MALDCKIKQSVKKSCEIVPGGVKELALINLSDIASLTETDGIIAKGGIVLVKDAKTYQFQTATETTSATCTVQQGANVDQKGFVHTVTGTIAGIPKNEEGKYLLGDLVTDLIMADMVVITKENTGKIVLYGWENGLKASQFDYATGAAGTDLNGTTFTFTGTENKTELLLDGYTWADVLALVGE